jgi:hypothetical protein
MFWYGTPFAEEEAALLRTYMARREHKIFVMDLDGSKTESTAVARASSNLTDRLDLVLTFHLSIL